LLDAERITFCLGTQSVADDLLHRDVDVRVVEAIAQPALERAVVLLRNQPRPLGAQRIDVLQDDRRLGHGAPARIVAQHRELTEGPEAHEVGARGVVRQIDDVFLEGDLELVQPDERLPAKRRQRMEMKGHGHGAVSPLDAPQRAAAVPESRFASIAPWYAGADQR
jgi:hypothetical protein